jgi:hypothetical protein
LAGDERGADGWSFQAAPADIKKMPAVDIVAVDQRSSRMAAS